MAIDWNFYVTDDTGKDYLIKTAIESTQMTEKDINQLIMHSWLSDYEVCIGPSR